jgi:hypothetical protein
MTGWHNLLGKIREQPIPSKKRLSQLTPPALHPNQGNISPALQDPKRKGWPGLIYKLGLTYSSSSSGSGSSAATDMRFSTLPRSEVGFKVPAPPLRPRRPKVRRENPLAIIAYGPAEQMVWRQRGLTYVAAMR